MTNLTRPRLTLKQRNFVNEYIESGNATEAAMRVYNPKKRATARAIGSENLTKPNIRTYLDKAASEAVAMVYELSQGAKSEMVRLNASKDLLDRAGYKPLMEEVNYESKADAIEKLKQQLKELFGMRTY